MQIKLPPLSGDDFEAACYRAVLGLIVPLLRGSISDFIFSWPISSNRSDSDWTACAVQYKKKHNIAIIFGYEQAMSTARMIHKIQNIYVPPLNSQIPLVTEHPIADPRVHVHIVEDLKPLI